RHDDACLRVVATRLADRLLGLAHGLAGHGTGVDDDRPALQFTKASSRRLAPHHFGFVGVEPAAEGDDVDAARRLFLTTHAAPSTSRCLTPVTGSCVPENSHSAGPVMMTWSSSRHSICSLPPLGEVISTRRSVRLVRAPDTAAAHAAEPQASVSPAPRSQVRIAMELREVTCAIVMFARSGKIGWFSSSGPNLSRSYDQTSWSTQKIACGFPIEATEGECSTGASMGPTCNSILRVSLNSSASGMSCHPRRGLPRSTDIRPFSCSCALRMPAMVSKVNTFWPVSAARAATTQRVPLPQACAKVPSEFSISI